MEILGIHWLAFTFFYFLLGFFAAGFLLCNLEEGSEFLPTVWLLWPIFVAWKILKLVFYKLPKEIIYTVKYLFKSEEF